MAVTRSPRFVPGVWGPYYSAMVWLWLACDISHARTVGSFTAIDDVITLQVPGYWLLEGGQSSTGSLLDHVINTHPASAALAAMVCAPLESESCCVTRVLLDAIDVFHDPYTAQLTRAWCMHS